MKYYRAKGEHYDYFTGYTTVPGELLTQRERDTKFRYMSDNVFDLVQCSRRKTYFCFGVRKPYDEADITLL